VGVPRVDPIGGELFDKSLVHFLYTPKSEIAVHSDVP